MITFADVQFYGLSRRGIGHILMYVGNPLWGIDVALCGHKSNYPARVDRKPERVCRKCIKAMSEAEKVEDDQP
jgi:hypothetical protein